MCQSKGFSSLFSFAWANISTGSVYWEEIWFQWYPSWSEIFIRRRDEGNLILIQIEPKARPEDLKIARRGQSFWAFYFMALCTDYHSDLDTKQSQHRVRCERKSVVDSTFKFPSRTTFKHDGRMKNKSNAMKHKLPSHMMSSVVSQMFGFPILCHLHVYLNPDVALNR